MFSEFQVHQNKIYRKELKEWLATQNWDYLVTFAFNRELTPTQARNFIKDWDARLNRKSFGPRWAELSSSDRNLFFAFFEHIDTNLHLHAVFKTSNGDGLLKFGPPIWNKLVKGGELDIRKIGPSGSDTPNVVNYLLKETWKTNGKEDYIISSEFHPQ